MASEVAKRKEIAFSDPWLKLLHYEKTFTGYKSKANRGKFFLTDEGRSRPELELKATLKAFSTPASLAACQFPARFELLKKSYPSLIFPLECPELENWINGIDAGDLYLVYSSAYPNNPASLFGHTFLRFDRKSKNVSRESKKLLGYSLAFQAKTNSDDNSLVYTFKGIMGGYDSYLEIKPHYMDIGIYNNSESRDLWEYKIELTFDEKRMLLLHTWEIIRSTTFPYFFLDENCSTLILDLLEAAKPNWSFKSKRGLFVIPQLTLKEVIQNTGDTQAGFRPAIKRAIWKRFNLLTSEQKKRVLDAQKDIKKIKNINKIDELDLLIDLWKLENYKNTAKMTELSKDKMNATLIRRSEIKGVSKNFDLFEENKRRAPHLGHEFKRLSLGWNKFLKLKLGYGFHNFDDPILGYDEKAYIDFAQIELQLRDRDVQLSEFKVIEILSLQHFDWDYPHISWNVKLWGDQGRATQNIAKRINLATGVGASLIYKSWQLYFLSNIKVNKDIDSGHSLLGPQLRIGFKKSFSEYFLLLLKIEAQKLGSNIEGDINLNLNYEISRNLRFTVGGKYLKLSKKFEGQSDFTFYF